MHKLLHFNNKLLKLEKRHGMSLSKAEFRLGLSTSKLTLIQFFSWRAEITIVRAGHLLN
jgi:hypothetical protein